MPGDTSVVPSFEIQLGAETRTLRYGFRAFKILGLNPFQPKSMMEFLGGSLENLDIDKAALWIQAGLAWEHAKNQPRHGEELPGLDDLIDVLDLASFMKTFHLSIEAAGLKSEESEAKEPADPPLA